jgi:hypothetical protein
MNKKNIIIIIIFIAIIGFIGFYLFKSPVDNGILTADVKTGRTDDAQLIYNLLQKMSKVKLDDSIFSNQIFQGLKDNSIEVLPQETGRSNPFAPINSISVTVTP